CWRALFFCRRTRTVGRGTAVVGERACRPHSSAPIRGPSQRELEQASERSCNHEPSCDRESRLYVRRDEEPLLEPHADQDYGSDDLDWRDLFTPAGHKYDCGDRTAHDEHCPRRDAVRVQARNLVSNLAV